MILVDGHQDIAWSMQSFGRDYTRPVAETRRLEHGSWVPGANGEALLGWPEYQRGGVALIFATLFATPIRHQCGAWDTVVYRNTAEANALYRRQVDLYRRLVDDHPDKFALVEDREGLEAVLEPWEPFIEAEEERLRDRAEAPVEGQGEDEDQGAAAGAETWDEAEERQGEGNPVGLLLLMENAEAVRAPAELDEWWELGVRLIGPAWGQTRFSGGTDEPGPLTPEGYALLDAMGDLGFGLDLSHMDEGAALAALDHYPGTIIATHANAAALIRDPGNRFLSDRLIRGLLERDGVIGLVPYNKFLRPDWAYAGGRAAVNLNHVAAQIDHVCQLAGDARHAALGSDFDGGFGLGSVPAGIDTIADLRRLAPLLLDKGYAPEDIARVLGGNWLRVARGVLP